VSLGIQFLSPTMSRFLLHLFAAFAEMEPEIIQDRVGAV
jgi:DNA invertase Pin-like site-specific DNA recombinase